MYEVVVFTLIKYTYKICGNANILIGHYSMLHYFTVEYRDVFPWFYYAGMPMSDQR